MTSEHVEEEIESSSCPSCLSKYPRGSRHFLVERIDSYKPRYVLEENYKLQKILRVQRPRASHMRNDNQNHDLRKRKNSENIDDEMRGQVTHSDLPRVLDEDASPEDARGRSDEAGTELEDDVDEVEDIGAGAEDAGGYLHLVVEAEALLGVVDDGDVEEERVERDGDDAGEDEDLVPFLEEGSLRVEDLAARIDRFGEGFFERVGLVGSPEARGASVELVGD